MLQTQEENHLNTRIKFLKEELADLQQQYEFMKGSWRSVYAFMRDLHELLDESDREHVDSLLRAHGLYDLENPPREVE